VSGGRASRAKGDRREREIVSLHTALGVKAERVPLSGATGYQGRSADVDCYLFGPDAAPLVCEVKARANGTGFATLERWLGDADALFLRRDRAGGVRTERMSLRATRARWSARGRSGALVHRPGRLARRVPPDFRLSAINRASALISELSSAVLALCCH
jgi:hypothetical protein